MFDINRFLNDNPNIETLFNDKSSVITSPYNDAIVAGKNSYAYDAHTYHTKVPPQGIETLIKYYTVENDVILDPFCGSGMTGLAAIRQNRNVILSDLSPAAVFIAKNFTSAYPVQKYKDAVVEILKKLALLEETLYSTNCSKCFRSAIQNYTVWSYGLICDKCDTEFILWDVARQEKPNYKESKILSEFDCPNCHKSLKKGKLKRTKLYPVLIGSKCCDGLKDEVHPPSQFDMEKLRMIDTMQIEKWYPVNKFPVGVNTKQPINHGIDSIDKLYTHRALIALSELWDSCINYKIIELRPLLMWTFTSLYQRVSVLSEFRFWGGSSNTANYNVPQIMNEQNVFKTFKRKADTIALHLAETNLENSSKRHISVNSATDLTHIPDHSIDYIFTDPPFGSNINYSEMNFLWESWLQVFTEVRNEAIVNKVQGKDLKDYQQLMTDSFTEMHRVLKDKAWLTVVFHNSSGKVWDSIRTALNKAGFFIDKAQIFDKKHGTFKMFVSDNAVGYDLILHCRKDGQSAKETFIEKSIEDFIKEKMKESSYVFNFIHVDRDPEIDFRKLYSEWIAHQIVGNSISLSFENFRNIVSKIIDHVNAENSTCF